MYYLQKPVTLSKYLVYVSKVNSYVNEYVSATKMLILLSLFVTKTKYLIMLSIYNYRLEV